MKYILLLLASIAISCNTNKGKITNKLDIDSWNQATFDFLDEKCQVDFDSYLKEDFIPTKINGQVFHSVKEYIDYCLEYRVQLLQYLKTNAGYVENIQIFERYEVFKIVYLVELDSKRKLHFAFEKDSLVFKSETTNYNPLLWGSLKGEELDCFNKFHSTPRFFHIVSHIASDRLMPKRVTLSNY